MKIYPKECYNKQNIKKFSYVEFFNFFVALFTYFEKKNKTNDKNIILMRTYGYVYHLYKALYYNFIKGWPYIRSFILKYSLWLPYKKQW